MKRRISRWVGLAGLLMNGVACEKPAPLRRNDTVPPAPPPPLVAGQVTRAADSPWDSSAGPVFLTIGPSASVGSVVFPAIAADTEVRVSALDVSPYKRVTFDLIGNGRVVGTAAFSSLVPPDIPEDCSAWPLMQLAGLGADATSRVWTIAFEVGRVLPISFDSIAGMTSSDSSRLAIDLARAASGVPGDTVAELRGLPYQVRRAYRFDIAPGVEGVLAEVQRVLNQEANPMEEHLLLVAERDSASRGRLAVAYYERTAGSEEILESSEILALIRFTAGGDLVAFVARYVGDGVIYSMLQRTGSRRWRLQWSSPYTGC